MNKQKKLKILAQAAELVAATKSWMDDGWYSCHAIMVVETGRIPRKNTKLVEQYSNFMMPTLVNGELSFLTPMDVRIASDSVGMDIQDYRSFMLEMFAGYIAVME